MGLPPTCSHSGIKGGSVVGALSAATGNYYWRRRTLRSRQIPCHGILGAHIVDHNLIQHGILTAVELKGLVQALVFLLVLLVVGKNAEGVLASLRVGFLQHQAHCPD